MKTLISVINFLDDLADVSLLGTGVGNLPIRVTLKSEDTIPLQGFW